MDIGKAMAIFHNIDSDKYSETEKAMAIYRVMHMETHMPMGPGGRRRRDE